MGDRLPRVRALVGAKADAAATARAVALAVVVALAGLTACSSAPVGETPESTVAGFYRALGAKDSAAACALVAYDGKPLAGDDVLLCRSGFDTIITDVATPEELAALTSASVTGAAVDGDQATVTADQMTGVPAAYREDVNLVRVGGRWYIESPL